MSLNAIIGASTAGAAALALIASANTASSEYDTIIRYQPATTPPVLSTANVTTREEATAFASAEFWTTDENLDGRIVRSEYAAHLDRMATAKDAATAPVGVSASFESIAGDDNEITESELIASRQIAFDEADANGDGALDAGERRKFAALIALQPLNIAFGA
ncbi:MAG: hypothetical protein KDA46_09360 [Parvularculaceae bacterium]|nr:hypothetical protein [Parvularculaceae bacterium]